MNEKNIYCYFSDYMDFVIATFEVVSFARVKKLKSVLEELFEELDEAFEEVDYEQDTFVYEIKELRERIKALEKTTNTVSDIETIKNAQFGIGTIMQRYNNNRTFIIWLRLTTTQRLFQAETYSLLMKR